MKMFHALIFAFLTILNVNDLSAQFDCLPNGDPIPSVPDGGASHSSPRRKLPYNISLPQAESSHRMSRSRSPKDLSAQFDCLPNGEPIPSDPLGEASNPSSNREHSWNITSPQGDLRPRRSRSRSPSDRFMVPPAWISHTNGLRYRLDQFQSIRITPRKNAHRHLKLRKYTFPVDERLKVLSGDHTFASIPTREQIVLSTPGGEALAILADSDFFSGIYASLFRNRRNKRAKIYMGNGLICKLTSAEIDEIPVGSHRPIQNFYAIELL